METQNGTTKSKLMRIAVTGPESTGKSSLAEALAHHYHTLWVPEYARQYLSEKDTPYTYTDILRIAKGQYKAENELLKTTDLLFCDTDFCVTSIWCTVKYGKCHDWITQKLEENHYDLYLLCNIDLPWQFDPLREHPEMRNELFEMYVQLLEKHHFNYRIVSGQGKERMQNAIREVDILLNNN
jgi:NadR type nicotinamide-nucleotide adenylyltransferase